MTKSHSNKLLLRVGELSDWLGVSRSTIYKWVKEDRFPEPLILGQSDGKRSASRWKTSEVVEWLKTRPRGVQHELHSTFNIWSTRVRQDPYPLIRKC